jgi:hypothetical protein
MLNWVLKGRQIEITFEQARAHLGMQPQRQWSSRVTAQTTLSTYAKFTVNAFP